ncbi:ABC transporter transmembrane domain-containing protein [Reichenbachiella agarivorans]|uniref:ABC transporter transmembrane domain-containing protein n=1 Tax=Reichenbachiella agarivorans TaxID=2979464 RepID=A0ABY6CK64_9BACT|nr:ABC transporter transmembrane domain-containing protein [Reichenbachiella agarivorans]UXP30917.1 ABC transporter transmembrane domain-containing protein [Reichenbachiella agarivorans]
MKFLALLRSTSPAMFFYALVVSVVSGVSSTYVIKMVHQFAEVGIETDPYFTPKFMGAVVLFGITGVLSSYFISVLTQRMIYKLRTDLSSKILNASFQKTERNLDKILPVLTADINFVSASMNRLPPVVTGLATAVGCIFYMFYLSWEMTLGSMGLFGIAFLINYVALPYLKKYSEAARDVWDKIHKNFEGVVYGMKELKLNKQHRENFIETSIGPNCLEENKYRVKEEVLYAVSSRIVEMILLMGIGLFIINMTSISWMNKDEFGNYLLVLLFTVAPLATVSGFLKHIKRTQVSLKKIDDIGVNLVIEPDFIEEDLDISGWNSDSDPLFSFKDVYFSYDTNNEDKNSPLDQSI